jgi:hypothetical protein
MPLSTYDRAAVVAYARQWALSRNPRYYDYDPLGGDCTNFASQSIYAGSGVMNYKPTFGWYYNSANDHSPSWTGVEYLYNFLTHNKTGVGPVGQEVDISRVQPGDISQFAGTSARFSHTQVIVEVGKQSSLDDILVCTHTYDSLNRPLSTYQFMKLRFIHIEGVRR